MAETNFDALYSNVSDAIDDIKDDVISSVAEEKEFLTNYEHTVLPESDINFNHEINITLKSLDEVNALLQDSISQVRSFEMPEKPNILNEEIVKYKSEIFNHPDLTEFTDSLENVYSQISPNSGYALSNRSFLEELQNALYSIGEDQKENRLSSEINTEAFNWSADGYTNAPGAMAFSISEKIDSFTESMQSDQGSVFSKLTNIIQKNNQIAFENGISIEKLHIDFAIKHSKIQFAEIEKATKAYTAQIEKVISEIQTPISGIVSIVKAAKIDSTADKVEQKLKLDKELAILNGYVSSYGAEISSKAEYIKSKIEISNNIAEAYGSVFTAYGSAFSGIVLEEQTKEKEE